jgi:hypothetical protein
MNERKDARPRVKSTKEVADALSNEDFRPSDFMRARRPNLFSDSTNSPGASLTKEGFEYHLETLTNRKEETVFEHFCRRLAEREICPNLLPQTGPTGGGDSKTDSENYPVAESIAMRWYEGEDSAAAAKERWAFAFSAKKKWRPKLDSDVDKIAKTKRGYTKIYFFTNQFVKDKERAALEDSLSAKHGTKVRIMDRSWILKCVFEHDRIELAVETLNLDQTNSKPRKLVGPRDHKNRARLETLEKEIADPERYSGASYQLVEDCLRAALLARNLELPKVDVEGRFARAEQIAQKVDHPQQMLRVAYNRAWTCFWWYEDLDQYRKHYSEVEVIAIESASADELQMLTNLWGLLHSSCARGHIDPSTCELDKHTQLLTAALSELANDKTRRNKALHARTELAIMDLSMRAAKREDVGPPLRELRTIIEEARGMISYPFEPIPKIVEELGDFLTDAPEYDELLEVAVSIARERLSQQEGGRMLLARGFQKLRANRIYDAIVLFGRAQQLLAMRESRWEISEALFACGKAYEAAGLLWAARANILASANQVLSDFWEEGYIAPQAMVCAQTLAWIEIQLGRPACVMGWIQAADALAASAKLDESAKEKFKKVRFTQDAILGMLLLLAGQDDLRCLQYLPDVLEGLELEMSRMAVLYSLGYEEQLRTEGAIPESESTEDVRGFFIKWLDQPAGEDLPDRLVGAAGKMKLVSRVLGCKLEFQVDDDNESIFLAERLLAAIEALLSTSLDKRVFPYREGYLVRVERSARVEGPPKMEVDIDRGISIVRHSGEIATNPNADDDWFVMAVAQLVSQIAAIGNLDSYLKRVMIDELGMWRAISFTEAATPISNILGRRPKLRISDWNNDGKPDAYIVRRIVPWHDGSITNKRKKAGQAPTMGIGDPPRELWDRSSAKHSSRQISSVINIPLWDKAGWGGLIYLVAPDDIYEWPGLGLGFKDGSAGKAIFEELTQRLGRDDKDDRLRISIITGIDKDDPTAYSLNIGSNLPELEEDGPREFISVSRSHRMVHPNPLNLKRFEERFAETKWYWVFPAQMPSEGTEGGTIFPELAIWKKAVRIVPAWQIGENDIDCTAIQPEDNPIIPPDVVDVPVLRLLDRRKRRPPEFL